MKYILPICAILGLSACTTQPVTSGISVEQNKGDFSKQLRVDNPKLAKKLAIVDVKTRQTNQLTDVVVTLASHYKKSQYLQYQFTWYDKEGFVIKGNHSPWQAITLFGFAKSQLSSLAPNAEAVSFSLAVREVSTKSQEFKD